MSYEESNTAKSANTINTGSFPGFMNLKWMVLFADMVLTGLAINKPLLKTFTFAHNKSCTSYYDLLGTLLYT